MTLCQLKVLPQIYLPSQRKQMDFFLRIYLFTNTLIDFRSAQY